MSSQSTATCELSTPERERGTAAEALDHLMQGKRHLLVQDIPSAVASLQEACKLMADCYGEMANECGEAYLYYGKALIELARDEAGVFGTVLSDCKEDDEEESTNNENEESQDEEGEDDESEAASCGETENEIENQGNISNVGTNSGSKKDTSTECTEPSSSTQPALSKEKSEEEKETEDEDVTNLQLAWETLELAKIIFQRQSEGNRDILLKLAEVHLHLGEVGLESENYDQAVEDMQRCLAIRQDLLTQSDRLLAETHYQLGLALCFDNFFDNAIEHFHSAVDVIKGRISELKSKVASVNSEKVTDSPVKSDDSIESIQREIEDLEEILPEIEEKITDTEDMKKNTADKLREAAFNTGLLSREASLPIVQTEESGESTSNFAGSSSEKVAKPIANISHLVKRKRKSEEANSVETQLEKKPRAEESLNCNSVSSSAANCGMIN